MVRADNTCPHQLVWCYMDDSLTIDNLSVILGGKNILTINQTIDILHGDVIAIVGPNGAVKTTLVNCLIEQRPYSGTIRKGPSFEDVGILFQNNDYGHLMKVKELISIVAQKNLKTASVAQMVCDFDLKNILDSQVGELSQGELQRLSLALVLYRDSDFLIFDELTTGLDFEKRMHLLRLVRERTASKTVLVVTHYFEEIVGWASKLLMLDRGHVVFWGTIGAFKEQYRHPGVILVSQEDSLALSQDANFSDALFIKQYEGTLCAVILESEDRVNRAERFLQGQGINYTLRPPDFYSMYRYAQERGGSRA